MAAEPDHSIIALYSAESHEICEVLHVQVNNDTINVGAALSSSNKGRRRNIISEGQRLLHI